MKRRIGSPCSKVNASKMAWPPRESCKLTEAPDKTLKPPQVQESNRWPTNIVLSLTLPKFQLASFKMLAFHLFFSEKRRNADKKQ